MGVLVELVRALPLGLRYVLSLLLFWPSILWARLLSWAQPSSYRLWDRVSASGNLLVGSAPVFPSDVRRLAKDGVTHIINACAEWGGHPALYAELGIRFLHAPTLDFDPPSWKDALRCADFIRDALKGGGGRVLVHCKAGKGRSVFLALGYFVLHEGMKPRLADAQMRLQRPQISRKWSTPLIQAMESLSLANAAAAPGGARRGSGEGGGGAAAAAAAAAGSAPEELFLQLAEEGPRDREKERLALRSVGGEGGSEQV